MSFVALDTRHVPATMLHCEQHLQLMQVWPCRPGQPLPQACLRKQNRAYRAAEQPAVLLVALLIGVQAPRASMAPSGTGVMAPWTSTALRTVEGQAAPSSGHVRKRMHSVVEEAAHALVLVRHWRSVAEAAMGSQRQNQLATTLTRAM